MVDLPLRDIAVPFDFDVGPLVWICSCWCAHLGIRLGLWMRLQELVGKFLFGTQSVNDPRCKCNFAYPETIPSRHHGLRLSIYVHYAAHGVARGSAGTNDQEQSCIVLCIGAMTMSFNRAMCSLLSLSR